MSAPAPPSDADLQAKAAALKHTEAGEHAVGVDPAVIAAYKKAFADNGGDKAKICAALGLEESIKDEYFASEAAFLAKTLGVKG
mmetsp:Transcript_11681/g.9335  ORF Transcript_11681/g.9335 Transcript_11681/m.9335 type:complete len:84 (-) Transcript_11681:200-451(-)